MNQYQLKSNERKEQEKRKVSLIFFAAKDFFAISITFKLAAPLFMAIAIYDAKAATRSIFV
jgi:hypothetical protein